MSETSSDDDKVLPAPDEDEDGLVDGQRPETKAWPPPLETKGR